MKRPRLLLLLSFLLLVSAAGLVLAKQLGAREAREKIATALGLDKPERVHIMKVSELGGEAVVEATVEQAFRFTSDKDGKWSLAEIRKGDRQWDSLELINTAIRKEKILCTAAELTSIATALEAYRREHRAYVTAGSGAALIDSLSPRYLEKVIRLDAWSQELDYSGTSDRYRLASRGPDGKAGNEDDIVVENGKLVRGARTGDSDHQTP